MEWAAQPDLGRRFGAAYAELRDVAARFLARERPNHTLGATALVHEAYLRLQSAGDANARDEHEFVRNAAKIMRQILVDHARRHAALKRQIPPARPWREEDAPLDFSLDDLLELDDALRELQRIDPGMVELIELRCFAGLTEEEVAVVRGVSPVSIRREWRLIRKWLFHALRPDEC